MALGLNCRGVWSRLYSNGRSDYEAAPFINIGKILDVMMAGSYQFYTDTPYGQVKIDVLCITVCVCVHHVPIPYVLSGIRAIEP